MNKLLIIISVLITSLGQCQTQSTDTHFGTIEDNFIGGRPEYYNVFYNKVEYPKVLKSEKIVGSVFYEIEIDTNGFISNFKILKGVHPLMDKEVENKIYLTNGKWKPLLIESKKVNYIIRKSVYFELR